MDLTITIILLILGHLLADYALQGDFMAKAKNHLMPKPNVPWFTVLLSHATIHGIFVFLVTGNFIFMILEIVSHAWIDYAKSNGDISFNEDQILHLLMKAIYVFIMFF